MAIGVRGISTEKYLLDQSIGYKLFHASRLMSNRLNQNFQLHGFEITYEQWQILSRLYEKDGLTQNQLAMKNERDQASISRLIDNMIKRNLVRREPNNEDRRIKHIYLTDESKQIQRDLEGLALTTISQATQNMTEEELKMCLKSLDLIRTNLQEL
ncbi:MarR family winged helix-turn-helix transcriptional regulator [Bacillus salitolerans]|uniref:MarR family winged helix-turn-helix transcriptional regulator n=1 Tax=Bacillus salitolerans TaxID=1437434 RepID=A0ABW4LWJ7_9BACI